MDTREDAAKTVLVVDDDQHILEVMEARLTSEDFHVLMAQNATEALDLLRGERIDMVISDVRMPGLSGIDLLKEMVSTGLKIPVILLTAYGNIPDAVKATKMGAADYLTKPFNGRDLMAKVHQILDDAATSGGLPADVPAKGVPSTAVLPSAPTKKLPPIDQVLWGGKSPAMRDLYNLIERVAPSDVNVLILGESGTGKERIAQLIHERSTRAAHPLVIVDCGSTPTTLLESELFGHVKGSFTHAVRDKKGLIEEADKGTLFLDEIGNISHEMQLRLLRFLESRKIRRIGDIKEISVNCRVLAATNADLAAAVKKGEFREDLYYRLKVITIKVPPLRDRREDIPLLAQRFVEAFTAGSGTTVRLSPAAIERLKSHSWPGNVRELKNTLEAAVVLSPGGDLRPEDLQLAPPEAGGGGAMDSPAGLSLDESEKRAILVALERANWVQKDAADILGISRRAIHYKIKKYGITIPGRRS